MKNIWALGCLAAALAIPVTAGAVAYKMLKLAKDGVPPGLGVPMVVGIITAGALALTAFAKIIDATSAAKGRRAYAKQVNYRVKTKK